MTIICTANINITVYDANTAISHYFDGSKYLFFSLIITYETITKSDINNPTFSVLVQEKNITERPRK